MKSKRVTLLNGLKQRFINLLVAPNLKNIVKSPKILKGILAELLKKGLVYYQKSQTELLQDITSRDSLDSNLESKILLIKERHTNTDQGVTKEKSSLEFVTSSQYCNKINKLNKF